MPEASMVPAGTAAPGPVLLKPARDQITPAGSPEAVNGKVWLVPMAEFGGVRVMAMGFAVPLTLMTWGEPGALSVSVMVSESWPEAVGTKVTVMAQVPMELIAPLQVFVVVKSPGVLPPTTTEAMFRVPVPEFVTVTPIGVLVPPWLMVGKLTGFGATVTLGWGGGVGVGVCV